MEAYSSNKQISDFLLLSAFTIPFYLRLPPFLTVCKLRVMLSTATTLTLANGAKTKLLLDISIGNMGYFFFPLELDASFLICSIHSL